MIVWGDRSDRRLGTVTVSASKPQGEGHRNRPHRSLQISGEAQSSCLISCKSPKHLHLDFAFRRVFYLEGRLVIISNSVLDSDVYSRSHVQDRTRNCPGMMTSVINGNTKPNISSDWSSLESCGACIMWPENILFLKMMLSSTT